MYESLLKLYTILLISCGYWIAKIFIDVEQAPIERVKLMVQNQDEMIRQGVLDRPYSGVLDCTKRVLQTEGVYPFWRGGFHFTL